MANNEDDYQVGRGKPPRDSQFKKGRSGNPKGRPRSSKKLAAVLAKIIGEKVIIAPNGRRRKVTKLDAAAMQLANSAAKGDLKAIQHLLKLAQSLEGQAEAFGPSTNALTNADREVIAAIHARLVQDTKGDDHG
jgi:hypothetical protein